MSLYGFKSSLHHHHGIMEQSIQLISDEKRLGSQILIFDIHKIADISDAPPTEEEIDDHIVCIENIIKRNCPGYLF